MVPYTFVAYAVPRSVHCMPVTFPVRESAVYPNNPSCLGSGTLHARINYFFQLLSLGMYVCSAH